MRCGAGQYALRVMLCAGRGCADAGARCEGSRRARAGSRRWLVRRRSTVRRRRGPVTPFGVAPAWLVR
jgi:hypothetical protein